MSAGGFGGVSSTARAPAGALGEQITAPGPVVRHVVSAYAVGGGAPTGSKPAVKLATLKARLSKQERANDTRRKVLLGALVLHRLESGKDEEFSRRLGEWLKREPLPPEACSFRFV